MNLLEQLPARPLGLGLLARDKCLADVIFDHGRSLDERVERGIRHDARAGAWREREGLEVDEPFQPAVSPRSMLEGEKLGDVLEHAGAVLADGDPGLARGLLAADVHLDVDVAQRRRIAARDLQAVAVELPGHHREVLARDAVDHLDRGPRPPDAVAEFGREVAGDLLTGDEVLRRLEQRADDHSRAAGHQAALDGTNLVPSLAADEPQFAEAGRAARHHPQFLAEAPKGEQPDAELAVHAPPLGGVEVPLHRVTEMRGDSLEVGLAGFVRRHTAAIIGDLQVGLALRAAAGDPHVHGTRIDRVLRELADRLERMRLRVGDDRDRVPLVADSQRAGCG